jgi:replicative DNA helicase
MKYERKIEKTALGAMMLDSEARSRGEEALRGQFRHEAHMIIYDAIITLHKHDKKISPFTVGALLKDRDLLSKVGGLAYLQGCVDEMEDFIADDDEPDLSDVSEDG